MLFSPVHTQGGQLERLRFDEREAAGSTRYHLVAHILCAVGRMRACADVAAEQLVNVNRTTDSCSTDRTTAAAAF